MDLLTKFERKVDKQEEHWIWTGKVARISHEGSLIPARRASLMLHTDSNGEGKRIAVTCGERDCVNPQHLQACDGMSEVLAIYAEPKEDRFWSKVDKSGDCWEWTGARKGSGYVKYGCFEYLGKTVLAHRLSYEIHKGEIPEGLEIDHLCFNPGCVNPAHLEAVTHRENITRAMRRDRRCKNGHLKTPDNVYVHERTGWRICISCRTDNLARHLRRKKLGLTGNHHRDKTHCDNGHPFKGDNVKVYTDDDGNFLKRVCVTCNRDFQRNNYVPTSEDSQAA